MVDSRREASELYEVCRLGFDLDQGMVLQLQGAFCDGAAGVHVPALLSTCSRWLNRAPVAVWLLCLVGRAGRSLEVFLWLDVMSARGMPDSCRKGQ